MILPCVREGFRRSDVLKPVRFGCLTGIPSLNITLGCMHSCIYCYARGYPSAPPEGEVIVYINTPELLERKLKRRYIPFVVLNTASDSFQPHPLIMDISYRCMEILIKMGVSFSFLTKGEIPEEFIKLFRRAKGRIYAHIGITTLNDGKRKLFEPLSAPVERRLRNIEMLIEAGIVPSVRMDPIIPFHTDSEENIYAVIRKVRELNVKEVTISGLHIRYGVVPSMVKGLGRLRWRNIESAFMREFTTVGCGTRARLIRSEHLERIYRTAREAGRVYGVSVKVCACKNPSFKGEVCSSGRIYLSERQLKLFATA